MFRMPLVISLVGLLLVGSACAFRSDDSTDNEPAPDEVLRIVTITPVPSVTVRSVIVEYVVEEGDTLSDIADAFGVSPQQIVQENGLANPDAIFVGQTLRVPAPSDGTPES
ncbi:hypothetical protein BH23CHL5_BH23CHL5_18230 [soil metagenome]